MDLPELIDRLSHSHDMPLLRLPTLPSVFICVVGLSFPSAGWAQNRLFPDTKTFSYPLASPRVDGLVGRVLSTKVSDNPLGTGTEGDIRYGKIFPVVALQNGPQPLHIGFGIELAGRFSLHDSKTSMLSTDWWAGLNLTKRWTRWEATLQLYHESSHLGDELAESENLKRLDWTRGVAGVWVGHRVGDFRVSGNLSYVLRGNLDLPPLGAAVALDWFGPRSAIAGTPFQLVAGTVVGGAAQTDWRVSVSGRAGLVFSGADGRHSLAISLIAYDGASLQPQFYDQASRYLGGEIRVDF